MKKTLSISVLHYEMLLDVAKRAGRKKPEEFLEQTIKNLYNGGK
jgi:hypothetical protein